MSLSNLATSVKIVQCANGTDVINAKYKPINFNRFLVTGIFLYPLRTSENQSSSYTPLKTSESQNIKKNWDFLMFSGGIERDQWHEMG